MSLYELKKELKIAQQKGLKFNQILILTIKTYSNLSHKTIHCYLKHRIPIKHGHFFRKLCQNSEYNQTHCNDRNNPFHFACPK